MRSEDISRELVLAFYHGFWGEGVVVKLRPRLAQQVPLPQSHLTSPACAGPYTSPTPHSRPPNDWLCSQAPRIDFGGFLPLSFVPPVSHQPTLTSASFLRKMGMGLVILWSCRHAGHMSCRHNRWTQWAAPVPGLVYGQC